MGRKPQKRVDDLPAGRDSAIIATRNASASLVLSCEADSANQSLKPTPTARTHVDSATEKRRMQYGTSGGH